MSVLEGVREKTNRVDAFEGYDLNGDGVVSREEMKRMFRAYFELSMELVREVVKGIEGSVMEGFDDEGVKPVSAAFSHPIGEGGEYAKSGDGDSPVGRGESPDSRETSPVRQVEQALQSPTLSFRGEGVMSDLSEEAIEEMVERVFSQGDTLSYSQFKQVCERDHNLICWIEALGSVF